MNKNQEKQFDNIISLGFNCQTAFAIQAFFYGNNKPPSNFFNWVFCHSVSSIINFLKDSELLGTKGLEFSPDSFMYKDLALNLSYHTTSAHEMLKGDFIEQDKKDVISRMKHLKEKFFNAVHSSAKNLFILVYPPFENKKDIQDNISNLSYIIKQLSGNKASKVMIVFEKKYVKNVKLPEIGNVIYRFTNFHSKIESANKIDFFSWYIIFKGFKIKNLPKLRISNVINYCIGKNILKVFK